MFALIAVVLDVTPLTLAELRWELAGVAIGFILLSVGLAATAVFFFRRGSDLALVYFGSATILYALRMLFGEGIIRLLFPIGNSVWNHLILLIDCFIAVPFTLLKIGERAVKAGNNVLIIFFCVLIAVYYVFSRPDRRKSSEITIAFAGLIVLVIFAVEGNLADLKLLPSHRPIEPIGFLIFVCCLGYVTVHRTLAREERLLAINKELQIANQIQSSILPREVPRLAGLEIVARYIPMSAVAGDFYDFLVVDDRRIGILVADVTGHGVPAALIASMLKVAFAGQTAHAEDPARVLAGLNHALCGKFEEHFVTAAYVFVDLEKLVLRYAGAGHPPLLLASLSAPGRDSESREGESTGLMLALCPGSAYAP